MPFARLAARLVAAAAFACAVAAPASAQQLDPKVAETVRTHPFFAGLPRARIGSATERWADTTTPAGSDWIKYQRFADLSTVIRVDGAIYTTEVRGIEKRIAQRQGGAEAADVAGIRSARRACSFVFCFYWKESEATDAAGFISRVGTVTVLRDLQGSLAALSPGAKASFAMDIVYIDEATQKSTSALGESSFLVAGREPAEKYLERVLGDVAIIEERTVIKNRDSGAIIEQRRIRHHVSIDLGYPVLVESLDGKKEQRVTKFQRASGTRPSADPSAPPAAQVPARPAAPPSQPPVAQTQPKPAQSPQTAGRPPAVGVVPPEFGRYFALVIGNANYRSLPVLDVAGRDAKAVHSVLRDLYGYNAKFVPNATRTLLLGALVEAREAAGAADSLLIYYGGHSRFDRSAGRCYWIPVDAKEGDLASWVSTAEIVEIVKTYKAKHVLIVTDGCFAGTVARPAGAASDLQRSMQKRSRSVLLSGGSAPTPAPSGPNSLFAKALLDALRANAGIIEGNTLFEQTRPAMALAANQKPAYADIRQVGHDGGDFLFVRPRK